LEPDDIQSWSESDYSENNKQSFLQTFTIMDDLYLKPTIFIFHELNSLYFIFRQILKKTNPASILKFIEDEPKNHKSITKRVRVHLPNKKNKTRKYLGINT